MDAQDIRLEIFAGDDPLRAERLLRVLFNEVAEIEGVNASWAEDGAPARGTKGVVEAAAIVIPTAAAILRAGSLKAVLVEFLRRDRRSVLRASQGDRTIELTGEPTPAMLDALNKILSCEPGDDAE